LRSYTDAAWLGGLSAVLPRNTTYGTETDGIWTEIWRFGPKNWSNARHFLHVFRPANANFGPNGGLFGTRKLHFVPERRIQSLEDNISGFVYNSNTFSTCHIPEDVMKITMLLVVGAALTWPQEDEAAKQAIASVQKAQGKVTIDRERPGHPVVAVDL
jgi:hypothetical protein